MKWMVKLALLNSRDPFKLQTDCALLEEELGKDAGPF